MWRDEQNWAEEACARLPANCGKYCRVEGALELSLLTGILSYVDPQVIDIQEKKKKLIQEVRSALPIAIIE